MNAEATNLGRLTGGATKAPPLPAAVDRATFQAELDRVRGVHSFFRGAPRRGATPDA